MALTDGSVQTKDLRVEKVQKSVVIATTDSAIWDMTLWKSSTGINPIIASDSGKVELIDIRNNASTITLTVIYILTY